MATNDKTHHPQIAVVGAGAIGSLLGGVLAKAGEDVTLVGRKSHVETIKQKGLTIKGIAGDFNVKVKAEETLSFSPDMVFISVKSQDVEETCKEIKPYIGDIPVVMMQNGVSSSEIAGSILGKEKIVSCTLVISVLFLEPGVVDYTNKNPIVIGEAFQQNGTRIREIQGLLKNVSRTEISDNIMGIQWTKLFLNVMTNSLDSMTGLPLGEYIQHHSLRKIGVSTVKEALQLVEKAGIHLEPIPEIPLKGFKMLISLPTPVAAWLMKYVMMAKGDGNIVSSTLQSLRRGKKTEIDYLNGEFVRLGNKIGTSTPFNKKVVELIKEIEKTGSFYSPENLRQIFSNLSS